MNRTSTEEATLRSLSNRVGVARSVVAQQMIERDVVVRNHGVAHPRSIAAARRLANTQGAYRSLLRMYTVRSSAVERRRGRGHQ